MKRKKNKTPEKPARDLSLVPLFLVPAALFAAPFVAGNFDFYALALPAYFLCLGVFLWFGRSATEKEALFPPFLLYSFLGVLVWSLGALLFFSPNRYVSALSVTGFISLVSCAALLSAAFKKKNIALYSALGLFCGAALCSLKAVALALALDGDKLFSGGVPRIFGGFANPNFFAGYLALAVPVGLGLAFAFKHRLIKGLLFAGVFFTLAALFLTGSKFGVAGLLAGLLAFFVMNLWGRSGAGAKNYIAAALIAVAAFLVFGWTFTGRVAGAGGAEAHSAEFRLLTWKSSVSMCMDHPFGVAPGRFEEEYPLYTVAGLTSHAHNSYLQFAAEYGIPCALLTGCWIFAALLFALLSLRRPERLPVTELEECSENASLYLVCGLAAGLCGVLCHSLADSDLHTGAAALACAVCCGALLSLCPRPAPAPEYLKTITGRSALLCMLVLLVFGLSEWCVRTGRYETAVRLAPIDAAAWMGYAGDTETASVARFRLKNAVREARRWYAPYIKLADLTLSEDPRSREAAELYKTALRFHPNSLTAMKRLAELGVDTGDIRLADFYYGKLLQTENSPYEKIKGVPEMVNTAYCDAHMYFADKALMEGDEKEALKHAEAACGRYARWLENRNYIIVALVNGMLSPREAENIKDKYLEAEELYGDLQNKDTAGKQKAIAEEVKDILEEYESLLERG
ncbi:MAG: O-antigen ligase family protein [Abditibacteriota bacterium]|nr:O-antigen ligase family protein [Abditibacteriota bacterium]